jgi:hypothetical protein
LFPIMMESLAVTAVPADGTELSVTPTTSGPKSAGKLFAAMHAVDADALVRYHFPTERLPTHTQVRRSRAARTAQSDVQEAGALMTLMTRMALQCTKHSLTTPRMLCAAWEVDIWHSGQCMCIQVLLSSATGRTVLGTWPQYSDGAVGVDGSNRPHVHLNVLHYYLVCT